MYKSIKKKEIYEDMIKLMETMLKDVETDSIKINAERRNKIFKEIKVVYKNSNESKQFTTTQTDIKTVMKSDSKPVLIAGCA